MTQTEVKYSNFTVASSRLLATLFLVVICCGTIIASAMSTYTVNVEVDGKVIKVTTSEQSPQIIIDQANVELGEKDKLDITKFSVGASAKKGNKLIVRRAIPITINDDNKVETTVVVAGTVQDALDEAGIICRKADKMNYDSSTLLEENMTIEIQRAFTVDVIADGKTQEIDFLSGTVADVLAELNITLGEDDEVSPSLETELRPGNSISVYRVTYEERTATETIKFETITKTSAELYKGTTQVEQEGKNGSKEVVYKDKLVDGKISKSTKLSEKIITAAVNKIVVTGTKIKVLSTSGQLSAIPCPYPLSGGLPTANTIATITGSSTAYYGGGGTASGRKAQSGHVAVDPREIPYGSELYVVSADGKYVYGYCIAADTGGFAGSSTKIDLYFDTYGECAQWGRRQVVIYVLSWGNG